MGKGNKENNFEQMHLNNKYKYVTLDGKLIVPENHSCFIKIKNLLYVPVLTNDQQFALYRIMSRSTYLTNCDKDNNVYKNVERYITKLPAFSSTKTTCAYLQRLSGITEIELPKGGNVSLADIFKLNQVEICSIDLLKENTITNNSPPPITDSIHNETTALPSTINIESLPELSVVDPIKINSSSVLCSSAQEWESFFLPPVSSTQAEYINTATVESNNSADQYDQHPNSKEKIHHLPSEEMLPEGFKSWPLKLGDFRERSKKSIVTRYINADDASEIDFTNVEFIVAVVFKNIYVYYILNLNDGNDDITFQRITSYINKMNKINNMIEDPQDYYYDDLYKRDKHRWFLLADGYTTSIPGRNFEERKAALFKAMDEINTSDSTELASPPTKRRQVTDSFIPDDTSNRVDPNYLILDLDGFEFKSDSLYFENNSSTTSTSTTSSSQLDDLNEYSNSDSASYYDVPESELKISEYIGNIENDLTLNPKSTTDIYKALGCVPNDLVANEAREEPKDPALEKEQNLLTDFRQNEKRDIFDLMLDDLASENQSDSQRSSYFPAAGK